VAQVPLRLHDRVPGAGSVSGCRRPDFQDKTIADHGILTAVSEQAQP
jgi:hypothetical protein